MPISITNKTRRRLPRVKFEKIADHVLGKDYELSLVFCGNTLSHTLNKRYRGKDKPTNVLAFPISKHSGEIFINLSRLGSFSVLELFIHGSLHLKGMEHGDTMEEVENQLLGKFHLRKHVASHGRWN